LRNATTRHAQALYFTCPDASWRRLIEKLEQAGTPYLFYDPFEPAEYAWLSWSQVNRATLERLASSRSPGA
jgi:hypothetical protein